MTAFSRALASLFFVCAAFVAIAFGRNVSVTMEFLAVGALFLLTLFSPVQREFAKLRAWWTDVDPLGDLPRMPLTALTCPTCSWKMMYYDSEVPDDCPHCGRPYPVGIPIGMQDG